MSAPRLCQLLGLLLIVLAGLLYTYHMLDAWPWLIGVVIAIGALLAAISTVLLHSRPRSSESPAGRT